jgi:hypothetical protein
MSRRFVSSFSLFHFFLHVKILQNEHHQWVLSVVVIVHNNLICRRRRLGRLFGFVRGPWEKGGGAAAG